VTRETVRTLNSRHRSARLRGRVNSAGAAVSVLLLCQALALAIQAIAVQQGRQQGDTGSREQLLGLSFAALSLTFASAVWVLMRPQLRRSVRNLAVVCLGTTTALQWRATDPLLFTGFDEQLHVRTLVDITTSHSLFQAHPLLGVSPHYPGLESLTAILEQLGMPTMAAATITVLLARLVLVLVLSDAVEQFTGSIRAGGFAVAIYAVSAQFVFFNSQFAYQTLALPLALAAVALVARARGAASPQPLLIAATTCLLAVAVTHHITSLLTAVFLALWAVAERDVAARRIRLAAFVAAASTVVWAILQWSLLSEYFGPLIDDIASQFLRGAHRAPFADPGGYATPMWERLLLVYCVVIVTLGVAVILVNYLPLRIAQRLTRRDGETAGPVSNQTKLLLLLVAIVPFVFASHGVPKAGEIGDRASSFLFLPFSFLLAKILAGRYRSRPPRALVRCSAVGLAIGVFLGGYLLGSGPDWARLPGEYLPSADGRSMDSETLAAVHWAGENLSTGSRIVADRVSSDLLASQARLWPVLGEQNRDVPSLYFADQWGPPQTDLVRQLSLRYLYVDLRLANELPHIGSYFHTGETPSPRQLTAAELTKFAGVTGIQVVYHHGPVSIYDLTNLGVPYLTSGWDQPAKPAPGSAYEIAAGMLLAVGIALLARTQFGGRVTGWIRSLHVAAGSALTFAAGLSALCIVSVLLTLGHCWLSPQFFASFWLAMVALILPSRVAAGSLSGVKLRPTGIEAAALTCIVLATVGAAATISIRSAYVADVEKVNSILVDPQATHQARR